MRLVSIKEVSRTSNYSTANVIGNTFVRVIIRIITYNNPVKNLLFNVCDQKLELVNVKKMSVAPRLVFVLKIQEIPK